MGAAIDRGIGVLCMLVHELARIITYEIVKLIIFHQFMRQFAGWCYCNVSSTQL